ncbi:MAG TPA: lamin tail domain-containing protein, partial [Candidatus Saccharimonadales bacterium]|nr:lamin tail domain-containing protein [Candidatus Saccharimonadales bacterium]
MTYPVRVPPLASRWVPAVLLLLVLTLLPGRAELVLTEFMASNTRTLTDEDGDYPDWIEIHNPGTSAVELLNWCLTDNAGNLTAWRFPSTNLPAGGYMIVFASGKDRRLAGAPLHTNFKLSSSGEFLGLVAPDGTTIVSAYQPAFPAQVNDVSFGLGRFSVETVLLDAGASGRVLVPSDGALGTDWTAPEFDDRSWSNAVTAIGFQQVLTTNNFRAIIRTDLLNRMFRTNATAYLRLPFLVADPAAVDRLTLQLKYDDGYIAYLNGVQISSDGAPDEPAWDSAADSDRSDADALIYANIPITDARGLLRAGTNILALQGLNSSNNSPTFLLSPRLVASQDTTPTNILRYFRQPTPGAANGFGSPDLGPVFSEARSSPEAPLDGDDLQITCRITPSLAALTNAVLHYRVMFSNEVVVPLRDDGTQGDGLPGDGVYGARIPAAASNPGQIVRWYMTASDAAGRSARWPAYEDPLDSPQYEGTMIGTTVASRLPVLHWFVENPAAAMTEAGTRCSIYYLGEFYDNVFAGLRGQASRGYPKKSYKLDFNRGYHFRFDPDQERVEEINLMTTSADKSFLRTTMAYESFRDVGCPWMISFPVRVQQNNAFYCVSILSEHPDETWLKRNKLDPNGAFYKMFNSLENAGGGDKRTRLFEDNRDLQELVTNINTANTNRVRWLYDNVNLAAMVNYLAVMIVIHDNDAPHKNYWMYRDTEGTREWRMLPWDKDLSFGINFNSGLSDTLWATNDGSGIISPSHPFFGDQRHQKVDLQWNRLIEAMYITPPILEMFKRRLRTVTDILLQSPGVWPSQRKYEARMDYFYDLMKDDVALDRARWPYFYGADMDFLTGLNALKQGYLTPRRLHLYATHSIHNPGYAKSALLPDAQPDDCVVLIGDVDYNPASGNQDEEYVQLINTNNYAAEISGWRLRGGIDHVFEPGTVIPSNSVLYVTPKVVAFRARAAGPRGGQTNQAQGNYHGHLSARGDALELTDTRGRVAHRRTYSGQPSQAQLYLRVTELMYHPAAPAPGGPYIAEDFEYIELRNIGPVPLDLAGIRFTSGVQFDFTHSAVTRLDPGQRVLVVKSLGAFASRYGSFPAGAIAGEYLGNLDNSGETVRLEDAVGEVILEFRYDNQWWPLTDGFGFSLTVADEAADWRAWDGPDLWRASAAPSGSPGTGDVQPSPPAPVFINEIFTASTPPDVDAVEIYNPNPEVADLSGWWLTDDFRTPKKYRLPTPTTIAPGGYLVLDEHQFNNPPGAPGSFSFSSSGDEVYLFSADADLTGYVDGFDFGPAEAGVSIGRYPRSVGEPHYVAQSVRTLGALNADPKIGPVVISEIHYHPPDLAGGVDDQLNEFVELRNVTTAEQSLFDPAAPTNTWHVRGGIEFDLPRDLRLPPGGGVVLVSFDPQTNALAAAAFRAAFAPPPETVLLGPFRGRLQNSEDRIELLKPNPPANGAVAYVLVDAVSYQDSAPWPPEADGWGLSLQRRWPPRYADDPASWMAAAPNPGIQLTLPSGPAPSITLSPADRTVMVTQPATFMVEAEGVAPVHFQWRLDGRPLAGATENVLRLT